jgi:hypothetical protein
LTAGDFEQRRQYCLARLGEMAKGIREMGFAPSGPDKLTEELDELRNMLRSLDCTEQDMIDAEIYLNYEAMEYLRDERKEQ